MRVPVIMVATPLVQTKDPIEEFKAKQRETWAMGNFGIVATFTTPVAAHLVRFAGIRPGQHVLDVGTGTGVVALTAARAGATVTGLDLTPQLLEQARANAAVAEVDVAWQEGDVEKMSFRDASFDVVLSQFGHMFAPRPDVAAKEMLRVLKPGGTIAFATWPPEHLIGRQFSLNAQYVPPPQNTAPPPQWGDPNTVRERLGPGVKDMMFERGIMQWIALSPQHYRTFQEAYSGPFVRTVKALEKEPARLQSWRNDVDKLSSKYLVDNAVRCDYLLTRATKT